MGLTPQEKVDLFFSSATFEFSFDSLSQTLLDCGVCEVHLSFAIILTLVSCAHSDLKSSGVGV